MTQRDAVTEYYYIPSKHDEAGKEAKEYMMWLEPCVVYIQGECKETAATARHICPIHDYKSYEASLTNIRYLLMQAKAIRITQAKATMLKALWGPNK